MYLVVFERYLCPGGGTSAKMGAGYMRASLRVTKTTKNKKSLSKVFHVFESKMAKIEEISLRVTFSLILSL